MEQKIHTLQEMIRKYIPNMEKDKHSFDNQQWTSDGRLKFIEQRLRDMEIVFNDRFSEQKKEFETIKQPVWDQVQRATRENEALQRELDRQQD